MTTGEWRQSYLDEITLQGNSVALTAGALPDGSSGTYTGDTPAVVINADIDGTQNALGSSTISLMLNITAGPTGSSTVEIWSRISDNGTRWSTPRYSHTVGETIAAGKTGLVDAGLYEMIKPYAQLYQVVKGYALTSQLLGLPIIPEFVSAA